MAANIESGPKLSEIINDIWKTYEFLETTEEPTNADTVQAKAKHGRESTSSAVKMVNELSLFSDNESIEEVSSNELKYLLLPALLAYFTLKSTIEERLGVVTRAKTYFTDYLRLCKSYEVANITLQEEETEEEEDKNGDEARNLAMPSIPSPDRKSKLQRYKQQKEAKARLKELHEAVNREHVDDEVKRDYYLTLLKSWVNTSEDEIESIKQEIEILKFMAKHKGNLPKTDNKEKNKNPQLSRPFIITKTDLQKQVLGAGYPSLPVYTIEEWADQQIAAGRLPGPGARDEQMLGNDPAYRARESEKQDLEKEAKLERDDPDTLKQARDWDEWKDDHRRGWGNRQNMG